MKGESILFLIMILVSISFLSSVNANPYSSNLYSFPSSSSINISGNLTNFTELLDTPSSYVGSAGKCVLVNPTETGLNFTTCPSGGGGAVDSVTSLSSYIIITPTTGDVEVDLNQTLLEERINLSIDDKVTQNFLTNILDSVYYGLDNPYNYTNKTLLSEFANDVGFITWAVADNGTLFRTDQYNASGLIRDWNVTGYIIDWNSTGYIIDWNSTGLIINWSDSFVDTNLNLLNGSNISIIESGLNRTISINATSLQEWLDTLYQPLGNVTNTSYITMDEYFNNATQEFASILWGYNQTTPAIEAAYNGSLLLTSEYNASGLIRDWNSTGLIIDWNSSGYIKNWQVDIEAANNSLYNWIIAQAYIDQTYGNDTYYLKTNPYNFFNGSNNVNFSQAINFNISSNTDNAFTISDSGVNYLEFDTTNGNEKLVIGRVGATSVAIFTIDGLNLSGDDLFGTGNIYNFNQVNVSSFYQSGNKVCDESNNCGYINSTSGGNPFDQDLNTTSNVTFQNINISGYTNVSGFINTESGYLYQGSDATGNFLKGDGVAFRPGLITASDVPAIQNLNSGFSPGNIPFQGQTTLLNQSNSLLWEYITETLNAKNLNITNNVTIGENLTASNIFSTNVCYSDGTNCTSTGGGGNPFDQSLNTTDSPTFNNLTVNNITINRQEFSGNSSWGSCFNGTSIIIGYIEGAC